MNRQKKITSGFTIIELGLVLIVMGLLAGSFVFFFGEYLSREKFQENERRVKSAVDAIEGYVLADEDGAGALPAPDEIDSKKYFPATLGENMESLQGQRFLYIQAEELQGATSVTDVYETSLQVQIYKEIASDGSFSTLLATIDNVAFVLISTGRNLKQETDIDTPSGSGVTTVSVLKGGDGANLDFFDDIIGYRTLLTLQAKRRAVWPGQ